MNKFRKMIMVFTLIGVLTASPLVAKAANHNFNPITVATCGGWKTVPDTNTKGDNEQRAYVTLTSKTKSSIVYARVRKASNNAIATGEAALTSTYYTYKIPYAKSANVKAGMKMKIQFQATTQTQTIQGRWCS